MYMRALRGKEKAVGKDYPRTQIIASNLQAVRASNDGVADQQKKTT